MLQSSSETGRPAAAFSKRGRTAVTLLGPTPRGTLHDRLIRGNLQPPWFRSSSPDSKGHVDLGVGQPAVVLDCDLPGECFQFRLIPFCS